MAYYIVSAGGTLYQVSTAGALTALTLPSDVTLSASRRARMAVSGRNVIVVNGGTRSLSVDGDGTVRPLIPRPPDSAPLIADGGSGGYSGTVRCKYTHLIKDPNTNQLIAESDFSPISAAVTVTSKLLSVTGIAVSPDAAVTHRRFYRTATGPGTQYFPWLDVEGNTITAFKDDLSDAGLGTIAAPTDLGVAPGMVPGTFMTLCVEWKKRLWGVGDIDVDSLLYSGNGTPYGWPATNIFPIAPVGADSFGITGLMPRRDELGIAKRNFFWKVVRQGSSFDIVKVKEGAGCWSQDTVVIVDDTAYFLGEDGVYRWDATGIECISNDKARAWFASDTYFNRGLFPSAFAKYNRKYRTIEFHLAAAGSSNIDRWVAYELDGKRWFGPHKTDAFTPTSGWGIIDINNLNVPVIGGSNGFIYQQNRSTFDDDGTAIAFDLMGKFHDGNTPDIEKFWNRPSLISKIQAAIGSVNWKWHIGALNATTTKTFTPDMRKGREVFARLGGPVGTPPTSRYAQMQIDGSTTSQGVEVYGYEVPFHEIGRR